MYTVKCLTYVKYLLHLLLHETATKNAMREKRALTDSLCIKFATQYAVNNFRALASHKLQSCQIINYKTMGIVMRWRCTRSYMTRK